MQQHGDWGLKKHVTPVTALPITATATPGLCTSTMLPGNMTNDCQHSYTFDAEERVLTVD